MKLSLKAYFTLKGIRQKDVAGKLGVKQSTFNRWLNGKLVTPGELRGKLCEIVGIDLDEFRNGNIVEKE